MISNNTQRSIVERDARYAAHRLMKMRCESLAQEKARAHRRYRRHIAQHLHEIRRGNQDSETWDLNPENRRLTGWDIA